MHEFVIEREIPGLGQMTEDQLRDISVRSLDVLKGNQVQTYTVKSRDRETYFRPNPVY